MLSYQVGENATFLTAVARQGEPRRRILEVGHEDLRHQVGILCELIESSHGSRRIWSLEERSRRLFSLLIAPFTDLIASSERLLIVADAPLDRLPWGVLIRDTEDGRQYLTEWKPFHVALVLPDASAKRSRHEEAPLWIAAFGDPRQSALAKDDTGSRPAAAARPVTRPGGGFWEPLPFARREAQNVARLFPAGRSRLFVGADATEENAWAMARSARILHFATHGYLDENAPRRSYLALAAPDGNNVPPPLESPRGDNVSSPQGDNGRLQVWEILEHMRLETDLVVLSACRSGAGVASKEGPVGLTRAFRQAGARSVVSALWNVADHPTAELMVRFYRHLKAGLGKAEALRAAQLELLRAPLPGTDTSAELDASAPYYWAAFQVYGDGGFLTLAD